jgi:acetyl-CoA C-acetyltransferase
VSISILAALRTPVGALGGSLRGFTAVDLGAAVLRGLLEQTGGGELRTVVLGQTVPAGCGPQPARAAALAAGLAAGMAARIPAATVNMGAASGLLAVLQAARALAEHGGGMALAGGMESCSGAPYLLPSARWGTRTGAAPVLDALLQDGQACPASAGLGLARAAQAAGLFAGEILPLRVRPRRGPERTATSDDALLEGSRGGPDSGLADNAAGLLLGIGPGPALARILAHGCGANPAEAVQAALDGARLPLGCIDRFELETPFPGVPEARCNRRGGLLALGRAAGADGARMLVSLTHQLHTGGLRYGLACLGDPDGPALALLLENP